MRLKKRGVRFKGRYVKFKKMRIFIKLRFGKALKYYWLSQEMKTGHTLFYWKNFKIPLQLSLPRCEVVHYLRKRLGTGDDIWEGGGITDYGNFKTVGKGCNKNTYGSEEASASHF